MNRRQLTVGVVTPHGIGTGGGDTRHDTRPRRHRRGTNGIARDPTEAALVQADAIFRGSPLDAVAHASTTSGYLIGQRAEVALVRRLSDRWGVPAVASCAAAAAVLQGHQVQHVQLVHPPWFDDELDDLGVGYFRSHGFDAVVTRAVGLTHDPAEVVAVDVVDWVERHLQERADAVFLAGNGFRAADAVGELERRTGRLVVEANQALVWGILAATRATLR